MAQNHHYLPRNYQKRWADPADPKKRVWVYQRPHLDIVAGEKSTKTTGYVEDLYTVFTSPTDFHDDLEDTYFQEIDQKGCDALDLMQSKAPDAIIKLKAQRHDWERYVLSLYNRHPRQIAYIVGEVINWHLTEFKALRENYVAMRLPDEPATWDEFVAYLSAGKMTPMGAEILKSFIDNKEIFEQFDAMDSGLFEVKTGRKFLTSDHPVIRYKGLKEPDGFIAVPVSPTVVWIAYNGPMMHQALVAALNDGVLIDEMNAYVVSHCIKYVYASDGDQVAFVDQHWSA
jgi:hypothetical protein